MVIQKPEAPVPLQVHHAILRAVEQAVIAELKKVAHPWMPVGMRVSYWLLDEDGRPTDTEYRHECGYVAPLDEAPRVEVTEEEWQALIEHESDTDPLPVAFVDALYSRAKQELEANANQPLAVGVAGVLTGSVTTYGSGCWCWPRLGRYRRGVMFCTSSQC
jgi:hypothetical protein